MVYVKIYNGCYIQGKCLEKKFISGSMKNISSLCQSLFACACFCFYVNFVISKYSSVGIYMFYNNNLFLCSCRLSRYLQNIKSNWFYLKSIKNSMIQSSVLGSLSDLLSIIFIISVVIPSICLYFFCMLFQNIKSNLKGLNTSQSYSLLAEIRDMRKQWTRT